MKIKIPNYKDIEVRYLVLDYNGTLANSGGIKHSTRMLLEKVSKLVKVYVITADTFGTIKQELSDLPLEIQIISKDNGTKDKRDFVTKLGKQYCLAIGNGQNDKLMLKEAEVGICVVGDEGCFIDTLLASDIVINDIDNALSLLLNTKKLIATLRK